MWKSGYQRDLPLVLQYTGQQRDLLLGSVVQWTVERSPIGFCKIIEGREIFLQGSVVQWIVEISPFRLCSIMGSRDISLWFCSTKQRDLPLVLYYNGQQRYLQLVDSSMDSREQQRGLPLVDRDISHQVLQYNGWQRDLPLGSVVQLMVERSPIRFCSTTDSRDISHQ